MKKGGARIEKVKIDWEENERGLYAADNIDKDEIILAVPESLIMGSGVLADNAVSKAVLNKENEI